MRYLLVVAVLIAASAAALATPPELGNTAPAKVAQSWPVNVPAGRLVGDTIESPFVVPELPYATSGTTAGFANDYDEVCPYSGSTAPDVVYQFVPTGSYVVDIDLCGSAYDTKMYVYDGDLNLVACNDDFYFGMPCGTYVSKIEQVPIVPGVTYSIVIDGYWTAFGEYELSIVVHEPCALASCDGEVEQEPPLHEGYVDHFNGGCNSSPPVFGVYSSPFYFVYSCLDGKTGWYQTDGTMYRDTDWYIWDEVPSGRVTFTLDAELPTQLMWLTWSGECYSVEVLESVVAGPCSPASIQVDVGPHGSCMMWIGPTTFEAPVGRIAYEYDWRLSWTVEGSFLPASLPLRDREQTDNRLAHRWCSVSCPLGTFADDMSSDRACDGPATPGPDGLAAVYLQEGEILEITNDPPIYPAADGDRVDQITYSLLTDLREVPGSCVGVHACATTGWHTFEFTAVQTGWHYLILDGVVAGANPVVEFFTTSQATSPPTPPAHDTCDGALTLAAGPVDLVDDLTAATNDLDPGVNGTYGRWRTGRDVVYRFEAEAGAHLDVTMTGTGDWDEELYVVGDCANSETTCLAIGAADDADGVHLTFAAPAAGTYWLVCDSFGVGARPFTLTGVLDAVTDVPPAAGDLVLEPCRPNPFNPQTTIAFNLPAAAPCRLGIFGLDGRRVRSLLDESREAGRHEVIWDGRDDAGSRVPSGLYVARLSFGGEVRLEKLALVK